MLSGPPCLPSPARCFCGAAGNWEALGHSCAKESPTQAGSFPAVFPSLSPLREKSLINVCREQGKLGVIARYDYRWSGGCSAGWEGQAQPTFFVLNEAYPRRPRFPAGELPPGRARLPGGGYRAAPRARWDQAAPSAPSRSPPHCKWCLSLMLAAAPCVQKCHHVQFLHAQRTILHLQERDKGEGR